MIKPESKKPELISPAGNFEKLKYAYAYGADAVYAGPPSLSLRARLNEFDLPTLKDAIHYSHRIGKKIYITLNLFAHEEDLKELEKTVKELADLKPDAFIVSDPGVLRIVERLTKGEVPLHLSTQSNTTNSESVLFWRDMGVKRVILARELSYKEIESILKKVSNIETEIFIHGAMCVSYSGRCLLSNFLTGRDSNRGNCSQPCRWKYYLVEETRVDQLYTIVEEERGTYILNSKDLCLIDRLEQLKKLHIDGYKIEGRTKNLFYTSIVSYAYRNAIDLIYGLSSSYKLNDLIDLINLTDNHGFTYGFMFENSGIRQNIDQRDYRKQSVLGYVVDSYKNELVVKVKNPVSKGEEVLGINPGCIKRLKVVEIKDRDGNCIDTAYGSKGDVVVVKFEEDINADDWEFGIISRIPRHINL